MSWVICCGISNRCRSSLLTTSMRRVNGRLNYPIKSALDNVLSSVMMADNDANIIYLNKTAERLFQDAEEDIRHDLLTSMPVSCWAPVSDQFHRTRSINGDADGAR